LVIRRWLIRKDKSDLTVHAAAMYWAYLFSQLEKIIFPVGKKIFLGIKKACG
jgi:hypothetical protein